MLFRSPFLFFSYKFTIMFEKFIEYGLHDTTVNDIIIEENGLAFLFKNGVYILSETDQELFLSKPCLMKIYIDGFDGNRLLEHCSFYKCFKKHFSEVDFSDIKKRLLKSCFDIDLYFYSPFAKAISLRGYIGKYMIEIRVTEIKTIEFIMI